MVPRAYQKKLAGYAPENISFLCSVTNGNIPIMFPIPQQNSECLYNEQNLEICTKGIIIPKLSLLQLRTVSSPIP